MRSFKERPVYKTTVDLLSTYKKLSEIFAEAKAKRQVNEQICGRDDDQGNYEAQVGELIADRYVVQECLGKGSFGVVVKAHDQKHSENVAVKIIKNRLQFFQQAKIETEILMKLNTFCKEEHNIVKLKKVFCWKNHLCLVFELLSFNLYELLKYTKFNGVSLNLIRKFAFQILKTLEYLASSHIGVIHCDLKPENILLKNPKRSGIKVIDFGSSCFNDHKMFKYIQSRFYRAPEVILGLHYDQAIDMWSLGAILVEMHTGLPVFDGKDEQEQLIKMTTVLNSIPQRLAEQSPKKKNFFQWEAKLRRWILAPPGKDVSRYSKATLEEILGAYTGGPGGRRMGQPGHSQADYLCFVDFVKKMFAYDAESRIKPSEALRHSFLSPLLNDMNSAMPLGKQLSPIPNDTNEHEICNIPDSAATTDARGYASGLPSSSKSLNKLVSPMSGSSAVPKRASYNASSSIVTSSSRGYKQDSASEVQPKLRSSSKAVQPASAVVQSYTKSVVRSRSSVVVSSTVHASSATASSLKTLPSKLPVAQTARQTIQVAASRSGDSIAQINSSSRLKPKIPACTSQAEAIEPAVTPTLHLLTSEAHPNPPPSTTYSKAYATSQSPSVPSPSFEITPAPSSVTSNFSRKSYQVGGSSGSSHNVVLDHSAALMNGSYPRVTRGDNVISGGYSHGVLFKKVTGSAAAAGAAASSTLRPAALGGGGGGSTEVIKSWDHSSYHGHGGAEPPLKVSC